MIYYDIFYIAFSAVAFKCIVFSAFTLLVGRQEGSGL